MSTHAHRGATYIEPIDGERLNSLGKRVEALMADGLPRTLPEIRDVVGGSEGGIAARLRELRYPEFGGWVVNSKRRSKGLWEYSIRKREPSEIQPKLFN